MNFPGCWMDLEGKVVYRVVPKCACSTIGQIMYFGDHGAYFDGDIHDAEQGIHKWNMDNSRDAIRNAIVGGEAYVFASVRNPYARILSSFMDKIAGIQRNGQYYRGDLVPKLKRTYGVEVEGDFDQIKSFRRFLLFVRDTIKFRQPMAPDIHWSSMSGHISTLVENGGKLDRIISTENFAKEMVEVESSYSKANRPVLDPMPRFNESSGHGPKRLYNYEDYFDDLSQHIVYDIYKRDFELFKYDIDPANRKPVSEIDLDEVHAKLSGH